MDEDGEEAFARAMRQIARPAPSTKDAAQEEYAAAQALEQMAKGPEGRLDDPEPFYDFEGED